MKLDPLSSEIDHDKLETTIVTGVTAISFDTDALLSRCYFFLLRRKYAPISAMTATTATIMMMFVVVSVPPDSCGVVVDCLDNSNWNALRWIVEPFIRLS